MTIMLQCNAAKLVAIINRSVNNQKHFAEWFKTINQFGSLAATAEWFRSWKSFPDLHGFNSISTFSEKVMTVHAAFLKHYFLFYCVDSYFIFILNCRKLLTLFDFFIVGSRKSVGSKQIWVTIKCILNKQDKIKHSTSLFRVYQTLIYRFSWNVPSLSRWQRAGKQTFLRKCWLLMNQSLVCRTVC